MIWKMLWLQDLGGFPTAITNNHNAAFMFKKLEHPNHHNVFTLTISLPSHVLFAEWPNVRNLRLEWKIQDSQFRIQGFLSSYTFSAYPCEQIFWQWLTIKMLLSWGSIEKVTVVHYLKVRMLTLVAVVATVVLKFQSSVI